MRGRGHIISPDGTLGNNFHPGGFHENDFMFIFYAFEKQALTFDAWLQFYKPTQIWDSAASCKFGFPIFKKYPF